MLAQEALFRIHARITEGDGRDGPPGTHTFRLETRFSRLGMAQLLSPGKQGLTAAALLAAATVVRLLVTVPQIGCVLGKSGSVIKAMREATGAQIRVMPKDARPPFALETDELIQVLPHTFMPVSLLPCALYGMPCISLHIALFPCDDHTPIFETGLIPMAIQQTSI